MIELEMTNQLVFSQKGYYSLYVIAYFLYINNYIRSPETLKGEKINHLCDIWSFGLVMIELARGAYPYNVSRNPSIIEMLDAIAKDPIAGFFGSDKYTNEFKDFVSRW